MLFLQQRGYNMKKYFEVLRNCALFNDISSDDLESILKCLSYKDKFYKRNDFVWISHTPFLIANIANVYLFIELEKNIEESKS